jgi:GT2 family glycosyltransferase
VTFIETPTGLCVQRNRALDAVAPDTEIVAFLDDDIELATAYFAEMARLFTNNPQIIMASGTMLHDGGRGGIISRDEAVRLCREFDQTYDSARPQVWKIVDSGYGCNMIVRHASIRNCRFDERLPLYAWLEDRDFSHRVTLGGCAPTECENAVAVHLGARSGRVSGVRLGFSTIVNPMYLKRKANTFSFGFIFVHYWLRCLAGNIIGIVTRDKEYDRVGLIRGNMIGFYHLLSGRCDPEYIFKL